MQGVHVTKRMIQVVQSSELNINSNWCEELDAELMQGVTGDVCDRENDTVVQSSELNNNNYIVQSSELNNNNYSI